MRFSKKLCKNPNLNPNFAKKKKKKEEKNPQCRIFSNFVSTSILKYCMFQNSWVAFWHFLISKISVEFIGKIVVFLMPENDAKIRNLSCF